MNGVLERTLGILELLSQQSEGMELAAIADALHIPRSAVHRLLTDLMRTGYVRQSRSHGVYLLSTKLVSLGLSYLSASGIVDIAQPLLNQLAEVSGELVRLSVVDGDRLTWVARAQGARKGLRYDPDMGSDARLSCSSSGWAWLASMKDDRALALVAQQGLGAPADFGPNAPTSMADLLHAITQTRTRGYAVTVDTYDLGLSAMSATVQLNTQEPMGVLTISGPGVRLTEDRINELAPILLATTQQLAAISGASPFFRQAAEAAETPRDERRLIYAD